MQKGSYHINSTFLKKDVVSPYAALTKISGYGKYPKISYTKVSDRMDYADSIEPDQTAPEGSVRSGSTLFAIPLSILRNYCTKSKLSQKSFEF